MFLRNCRRWLCLVGLCALLVGCQPPDQLQVSTPTPLPTESIEVFIGALQPPTPSSTEDLIALLVSKTRVRAMLCSLTEQRWQNLDTWFGQGDRTEAALTARSVSRNAQLTATLETPQLISGDVQTADGTSYHFQAQRLASTADYEAGKAELIGVYTVPQEPLPDGRLATFYAMADPTQDRFCGMLLYEDQPVTRVQLDGTWQASFSVFALPDAIGIDKASMATMVWNTPRHVQRIEGILLPNP